MSIKNNVIIRAFLNYQDVLVRSLLRMSVDPADVDDILQESLARTLESNNDKQIDYPKSYLFSVSRNMVLREQERRSREILSEIDEAIFDSNAPSVSDGLYYRQMLQVFWEAMDTLPKSQRRAILLRRIYGLSHKEISKKMNVSISSVEKYFAHGISRCHDIMHAKGYTIDEMASKSPERPGKPEKNLKRAATESFDSKSSSND